MSTHNKILGELFQVVDVDHRDLERFTIAEDVTPKDAIFVAAYWKSVVA